MITIYKIHLLHCWQNRCSRPPIVTLAVFECASQTLWRRWYSRHRLRSASHPSTKHWATCVTFPGAFALFDDPENDDESIEKSWKITKSFQCLNPQSQQLFNSMIWSPIFSILLSCQPDIRCAGKLKTGQWFFAPK